MQKEGAVAYFRWKVADIGMIGCLKHLTEIFEVLRGHPVEVENDEDSIVKSPSGKLGNEWGIYIEKAENGFIVMQRNDYGAEIKTLIQEKKFPNVDEESRQTAQLAADLCWEVIEAFALYGSKHDKYRVKVKVIKQHEDKA